MGLADLLGGGSSKDDFNDFVQRFGRGSPHDGYDDREAHDRHERVREHLSDDEYEESAREAFSKMSPDERRQLGRTVRSRAKERGMDVDDDDSRDDDAGGLASMVGGLQRGNPGILGSLLGGGAGGGGGGGNPLAKMALGGIAAMAAKKFMGGR